MNSKETIEKLKSLASRLKHDRWDKAWQADISSAISLLESMGWREVESAPKDGSYILLAGPSGYSTTPLRVEVGRYDAEYRPFNPWVTFSNDAFTDGGEPPTHWMPLPPITTAMKKEA
jgi:hypothetical protein